MAAVWIQRFEVFGRSDVAGLVLFNVDARTIRMLEKIVH
jgi:hypothetical protein